MQTSNLILPFSNLKNYFISKTDLLFLFFKQFNLGKLCETVEIFVLFI